MGPKMRKWAGAGIAAAMAFASAAAPAAAANIILDNFWLPNGDYSVTAESLPACTDPLALGTISMRFAETERMYWNAALNIGNYYNVREIALRPWGPDFQPRRYCSGTVTLSDASAPGGVRQHAIYYSIIQDSSFQGYTWGVEWCIVGLDRNLAYAPNCKMARP